MWTPPQASDIRLCIRLCLQPPPPSLGSCADWPAQDDLGRNNLDSLPMSQRSRGGGRPQPTWSVSQPSYQTRGRQEELGKTVCAEIWKSKPPTHVGRENSMRC